MNEMIVPIDIWQLECCGNPCEIGETVEWIVNKITTNTESTYHFDADLFVYYYNNCGASDGFVYLQGIVKQIYAEYVTYDIKMLNGNKSHIPSKRKIVPVNKTDYWTNKEVDDWHLYAFFVRLEDVKIKEKIEVSQTK